MHLHPLAYLAGLLPLATIHLTYLLSAIHGQVSWCIPYLHSCTSISATGRYPPAYFVFKGMMIPAAVILFGYWLINAAWLKSLGCSHNGWRRCLEILGVVSALGLIFYATLLGSIGPDYQIQRHMGVSAFFGFSLLAQLLITWLLHELPQVQQSHPGYLRLLKGIIFLVVCIGLASVVTGFTSPSWYQRTDNAVAWNLTLFLTLHILITARLWQKTRWRMTFSLQ